MGWVLLWVVFSGVSAQNIPSLNINAICKDEPEAWRCESLSHTLKVAIKRDQKHVYGNDGHEPILCIPSSQSQPTQITQAAVTTPIPEIHATTWPTTSLPSTFTEVPKKSTIHGSNWTTTPKRFEIEPTTIKTSSQKSKAEQMCEVYSQYVYQIIQSPAVIGNKETIKIPVCRMRRFTIGGGDAKPKEFPHMAHIGFGERPQIRWACGGSLISPKFVLSAAHCTSSSSRATWVRLGDIDDSTDNDNAERVEVRIINGIAYPHFNKQLVYHDIALIELESEVKLGPYIRPLCLHSTKDIYSDTALASGWGHTAWGGAQSKVLKKVNVTLVSHKKCIKSFNDEYKEKILPNGIIDDLMFCAGGKEGDACQGDSGGPLVIPHKGIYCMYFQIGVISFGKACGLAAYPGVYTRVSNYLPWIESVVWP